MLLVETKYSIHLTNDKKKYSIVQNDLYYSEYNKYILLVCKEQCTVGLNDNIKAHQLIFPRNNAQKDSDINNCKPKRIDVT